MDLSALKGVGEKTLAKLNSNEIFSIRDVVKRLPVDYSTYIPQDNITMGDICLRVRVSSRVVQKRLNYSNNTMQIFSGMVGNIKVKFMSFGQSFLSKLLKVNQDVLIYGTFKSEFNYFLVKKIFFNDFVEKIEVSYNLKNILDSNYQKIVYDAFKYLASPEEILPECLVAKYKFINYSDYLLKAHFPQSTTDIKEVKRRQTYQKFFFYHYASAILKLNQLELKKEPRKFARAEIDDFIRKLPFSLTDDQRQVVDLLLSELTEIKRINRLIQGDVGCGKTIVAFVAAYATILSGYQVALLAPTEILAEEHYFKAKVLFPNLRVAKLTSSLSNKEKKTIIEELAQGKIDFILGTQALIQDKVEYHNLGLVIVDEQHRFGVLERSSLQKKYPYVDAIYFSATPIPRTLALTMYHDLDLSIIKTMPQGRKPIITKIIEESRLPDLVEFINERIELGEQVFIVVPMIEDNEQINAWSIDGAYNYFKDKIKSELRVLSGKTKAKDKNVIMEDFRLNKFSCLISTTVIEVGIDVKNVTSLVLLNAERFGLAQAHQLRGRVGRGDKQSYFFLVSNVKNQRLDVLVNNTDGFKIAEADFQERGPGDYLGVMQSGFKNILLPTIDYEMKVLEHAKKDAYEYALKTYKEENGLNNNLIQKLKTRINENN